MTPLICIRRAEQSAILKVSGDIDLASSPVIRKVLVRQLRENRTPIVTCNLVQVVSADYAFQSGTETWREAIRMRATELRVLDTFHAEVYEVSRIHPGYGFAAYGEKAVLSKFVLGGGYADIDRTMLNSDRFGRGKRFFLTAKIPINEAFSILMFATQATDHNASNLPQQRLDIGFYYNLLYDLRKTGIF